MNLSQTVSDVWVESSRSLIGESYSEAMKKVKFAPFFTPHTYYVENAGVYEAVLAGAIPVFAGTETFTAKPWRFFKGGRPPFVFRENWDDAHDFVENKSADATWLKDQQKLIRNWWYSQVVETQEKIFSVLKPGDGRREEEEMRMAMEADKVETLDEALAEENMNLADTLTMPGK